MIQCSEMHTEIPSFAFCSVQLQENRAQSWDKRSLLVECYCLQLWRMEKALTILLLPYVIILSVQTFLKFKQGRYRFFVGVCNVTIQVCTRSRY